MSSVLRRLFRRLDKGPPAYAQIEDRLAEAIVGGDLGPGARLPPERTLAERFGVSRMTLRQALDSLEHRGLLLRTRGRKGGTFAAEALAITPGDQVFEVIRVRLSDGEPLALERSLFPASRFPGLLDLPLEGSMYELLERQYGERPTRAVERLEPVVADAREAEILRVPPGSALMLVERTAYDEASTPVEYARDLFRGDRTRVVVESSLPAARLQT
jgi:GntR family transcriptional regulator